MSPPALAARCTVHLERVALHREPAPAEIALLDDGERERAAAFVVADERRRFLASHVALRRCLAGHLERPAEVLRFAVGGGRPRLRDLPAVEFSLAHSGDVALIAVTHGVPVGVDVEQVRDLDAVAMAGRVLTEREAIAVATAPEHERGALFFRHWALTEAYLKARGIGLAGLPGPTFTPAAAIVSPETPGWTVVEIPLGPGYAAAVALPSPGAALVAAAPGLLGAGTSGSAPVGRAHLKAPPRRSRVLGSRLRG